MFTVNQTTKVLVVSIDTYEVTDVTAKIKSDTAQYNWDNFKVGNTPYDADGEIIGYFAWYESGLAVLTDTEIPEIKYKKVFVCNLYFFACYSIELTELKKRIKSEMLDSEIKEAEMSLVLLRHCVMETKRLNEILKRLEK